MELMGWERGRDLQTPTRVALETAAVSEERIRTPRLAASRVRYLGQTPT